MTNTIEDDEETQATSTADAEIREAFGGVIAAILDHHPESPTRQRAIELVIACHATVSRVLSTPTINGISACWIQNRLH
jgi:hypothetical protein